MIRFLLVAAGVSLAAIAGAAARADAPMRAVSGAFTLGGGAALPPDAELVVSVRDAAGAELGAERRRVEDQAPPLPFRVWVPAGGGGSLAGEVVVGGAPAWTADAIAVEGGTGPVDLGTLPMDEVAGASPPPSPAAPAEEPPAAAETGAAETGAAETGAAETGAAETGAAAGPDTFRASGNEPFWSLEIGGAQVVLRPLDGEPIEAAAPEPERDGGRTTFRLTDEGVTVTLDDALCRDTMSGMLFPASVTVDTPDGTFEGCGGDTYALLEGDWRVESVAGETVADDAEVTIAFLPERSVAGQAACNRYIAELDLTGEGLAFGEAGATRMACPEPLMALESRFLAALDAVTRFDLPGDGSLALLAGDEPVIEARR